MTLRNIPAIILFCVLSLAFALPAAAQKRDHLTEQEIDLIRDFQEIDKRVEIFIKCAERRLLLMTGAEPNQSKREEEMWGPWPFGTKLQLLQDYKGIMSEAMEKLEDAYERDPKSSALAKGLKKFKEAATRHIPQLRSFAPQLKDKKEQEALLIAIEEAETATKGTT
ncbi:MAG: hypothetical protein ACKV2V_05305 [Blastocatellia bacterium]